MTVKEVIKKYEIEHYVDINDNTDKLRIDRDYEEMLNETKDIDFIKEHRAEIINECKAIDAAQKFYKSDLMDGDLCEDRFCKVWRVKLGHYIEELDYTCDALFNINNEGEANNLDILNDELKEKENTICARDIIRVARPQSAEDTINDNVIWVRKREIIQERITTAEDWARWAQLLGSDDEIMEGE